MATFYPVGVPVPKSSDRVPEPSLILGFMALGGLMLGGKRNTRR
ncbi:PEP-CTERM sorting domain-containing protein [Dapis sp. BLCC M126]